MKPASLERNDKPALRAVPTVEGTAPAESMTLMFDALRTEALTGSASLKLIEEAIQRWKEQTDT
jgi:hypothetical protein